MLKVSRIGNSRGIWLPAALLRKYQITDKIIAEEKAVEIVLRPARGSRQKLSWEEIVDPGRGSELRKTLSSNELTQIVPRDRQGMFKTEARGLQK